MTTPHSILDSSELSSKNPQPAALSPPGNLPVTPQFTSECVQTCEPSAKKSCKMSPIRPGSRGRGLLFGHWSKPRLIKFVKQKIAGGPFSEKNAGKILHSPKRDVHGQIEHFLEQKNCPRELLALARHRPNRDSASVMKGRVQRSFFHTTLTPMRDSTKLPTLDYHATSVPNKLSLVNHIGKAAMSFLLKRDSDLGPQAEQGIGRTQIITVEKESPRRGALKITKKQLNAGRTRTT